MSKRTSTFILLTIILIRFALMLVLESRTSTTFDESQRFTSAQSVVQANKISRNNDSNTPLMYMNPILGERLHRVFPNMPERLANRMSSILISLGLTPASFALATLLGATPPIALIFTVAISFDPSLLQHSVTINHDVGGALGFLIVFVCLLFWTRKPSFPRLILAGLLLGAIQACKFTGIYFVPLSALWILWHCAGGMRRRMGHVSLYLVASWIGLQCVYAWDGFWTPFVQIPFWSTPFIALRERFPHFPAFLPVDYLRGIDWSIAMTRAGNIVFMRGEFSDHPFASYFLYGYLIKTPIPYLLAAIVGWGVLLRKRIRDPQIHLILLFFIPLFIYFSFLFSHQLGIRYLFSLYPLFLVGLIAFPWTRLRIILLSFMLVLSLGINWPNYIGYFNEFIFHKESRWWHLNDSNLAWGQDDGDWFSYAEAHGLSKTDFNPMIFPIDRPFHLNMQYILPMHWLPGINPDGNLLMANHLSPIDSFRGSWNSYVLTSLKAQELFTRLDSSSKVYSASKCSHPISRLSLIPSGTQSDSIDITWEQSETMSIAFQIYTTEAIDWKLDQQIIPTIHPHNDRWPFARAIWQAYWAPLPPGVHRIQLHRAPVAPEFPNRRLELQIHSLTSPARLMPLCVSR